MGWLKDKLGVEPVEPIECPRGWGQVSFVPKIEIFEINHRCPIGGVTSCEKCRYQVNPASTELLRLHLEELEALRGSTLSEAEFRIRRRLIVEARDPSSDVPGQEAAVAAFILGPLGVVTTLAGWYLSATVSLGFLAILAGGLVLSALAVGTAAISKMERRALANPDDPHFEDFRHDTSELEAELGRAREELGFFRELHEGESSGKMRSPDGDDS